MFKRAFCGRVCSAKSEPFAALFSLDRPRSHSKKRGLASSLSRELGRVLGGSSGEKLAIARLQV